MIYLFTAIGFVTRWQ